MPHAKRLPASIIVVLTLALFALLSLPAAADSPDIALANPTSQTFVWPADVAIGDLDNDGDLDMVVADATANQVSVRLGDGAGNYGLAAAYPIGGLMPMSVVLADLDGDGDLDAATANRDSSNVSVLLNNGAGALGPSAETAVGAQPLSIDAGDLYSDGDIDLAVSCKTAHVVYTLENNGAGAFTPHSWPVGSSASPDGLIIADLDNDLFLDIAVIRDAAVNKDQVQILWNDALAGFASQLTLEMGTGYLSNDVRVANLNHDGWPDVIATNVADESVTVFLGNGWRSWAAPTDYECTGQTRAALAVDLNGDGALDLVAPDQTSSSLNVFPGDGDGAFGSVITFPAAALPGELAAGDLNKDGRPDLAVCNRTVGGVVGVYLNTTAWDEVNYGTRIGTAAMPGYVKDLAMGDLNHDGRMDVVALVNQSNMYDEVLAVSLRQPDGSYSVPVTDVLGTTANQVALADLDHDGDLDVVATCDHETYFGVWRNDGAGAIGPRADIPTWDYNYGLAIVDWDRDGSQDVVVTNQGQSTAIVYAGNGIGGFGPANPGSTGANTAPYALAVGDLNHDGLVDATMTLFDAASVATMLNSGAGNFLAPNPYPAGPWSYDCDVADLNGDGNLDAMAVSSVSEALYTYTGVGDGTLSPLASYGTGGSVASVRAGDVDRDGDQDVIVPQGGTAYRYTNDGAGALGSAEAVGSLSYIEAILDVDHNGMPDLVGSVGSDVVILYGTADNVELSIAKSVEPVSPFWGDAVTYTIEISNTGNMTGTGVLVTDTFPSDYVTDVVSATSGLAMSNFSYGAEWAWTVEDIAPGASGTITLTGVLTDYVSVGDPFDNVAEIDCNETDVVSDTASATVGSGCVPTFTVISDADDGPGTLRQAMAYVCDGGTIDFDLTYPATITLTSGQLDRALDVTILGPGAGNLAVSGGGNYRVLKADESLDISGVTIRDGSVSASGAGLYVWETLVMTDVVLYDNDSGPGGGGAYSLNGDIHAMNVLAQSNDTSGSGGGLFAWTNLVLTNTQLVSNTSSNWGGGAIANTGSIQATNVDAIGNSASRGGGLFAWTNTTLNGGSIIGNESAQDGGGALANNGTLDVTDVSVRENTAASLTGGGLYASGDISITGGDVMSNTAAGSGGGVAVFTSGSVTVSGTQMISNTSGAQGGAVYAKDDVTIINARLERNVAGTEAGAVYGPAAATITNTQFISNTAGTDSGAVRANGLVTVSDSLFQGNVAETGNAGAFSGYSAAVVSNCDFVDNKANVYYGAMYCFGDATISDSLFQGNQAVWGSEGAFYTNASAIVSNTDFYSNTARNDVGAFAAPTSATISDSFFQGNKAQFGPIGAVWSLGPMIVTNTEFISNTASGDAGAIQADVDATISGCLFRGNQATIGQGGAGLVKGQATISNSQFVSNTAVTRGGAVYAASVAISGTQFISNTQTSTAAPTHCGGAVYYDTLAIVENALFERNTSGMCGGGLGTDYAGPGLAMITNTTFLSNTARSGGGVHAVDAVLVGCTATGNQAAYNGGAVVAEDGVSVVGGTFAANTAANGGGAAAANTVHAQDATFTGNTASSAGALAGNVTASATNCTFTENEATGLGAGMQYGAGAVGGLAGLSLDGCEFYSNTTALDGGAAGTAGLAYITGSTFEGNTAAQTGGAVCITQTGQLMLTDSTFEDNVAGADGGAVLAQKDAIVVGCEFIGNTMTGTRNYGGALRMTGAGDSGIVDSTFVGNHSNGMGGAIGIDWSGLGLLGADLKGSAPAPVVISNTSVLSNTANVGGGGIVVDSGYVTMYDSTVAYNVADDGATPASGAGTGGGIQFMDIETSSLTNCTIANNTAAGADDDGGGGIIVYHMLPAMKNLELSHVTIVGNATASSSGAAGVTILAPEHPMAVAMTATLIAGNTASGGSSSDILANIVSHHGNLVGVAYDYSGLDPLADQYGSALSPLDALTGPLGNYGGDTLTVPLLPGSPAINTGGPSMIALDQRGVTRDLGPDVGAFESRGFDLSLVGGSDQSTPAGSAFPQPLVAGVSSSFGEPVDGGVVAYSAPMSGPSATFAPVDPATISGGQAQAIATANDIVGGPYLAQAKIPTSMIMATGLEASSSVYYSLTNTLPLTAESSYSAGPDPVCPGYNIYHTLIVTNTSAALGMAGLEVVGAVPDGTEFYGEMSPEDGVYNAAIGEIVWNLPEVPAGEAAVIEWTTHVLNGTASETELFGATTWTCDLLAGATHTQTVTVDDEGCAPPPPEPLTIHGVVFVEELTQPARGGSLKADTPIEGAVVTATTCVAGTWVDVTNADGEYSVTIPGEVVEQCDEITLEVYAEGYGEDTGTWTVAELRADGVRDWAFEPPEEWWLYLAIMLD